MLNYWWIFLGGGAGSLLRFAFTQWWSADTSFPWATLAANAAASLLLGIVLYFFLIVYPDKHSWRLLLAVGFCGGFSTFSTFSYESFALLAQQQYTLAVLNIVVSVSICLIAVAIGWWGTQWVWNT